MNSCESVGTKHYNDFKKFIEYSTDMKNVHTILMIKSQEETKTVELFDNMIADMISHKNLNRIVK